MIVGCSSLVREQSWRGAAPETEAEHELCNFDKKWSPTLVARYHEPDGRLFFGDIKASDGFADKGWTTIRSAKAQPEELIYTQKVRTDCYNESKDAYYPCVRKLQVDLREVGAVVRSNLADPAEMAVSLCSQAARQAWKEQVGTSETNDSQKCSVTVRAICPLPAPSGESDAAKE